MLYPENLDVKNIATCREKLKTVQWHDYVYEGSPSINNPSGGDQCTYIYSFNSLDEVEKLHKVLNVKLDRLSIDDNSFIYKSHDKTCANNLGEYTPKSITWSVKTPEGKTIHNATKIIGDKLTWNILGLDCYNVSIESTITKKLQDEKASSVDEKSDKQSIDSMSLWTTIGSSVATIIATIVAYLTYIESKKKR